MAALVVAACFVGVSAASWWLGYLEGRDVGFRRGVDAADPVGGHEVRS